MEIMNLRAQILSSGNCFKSPPAPKDKKPHRIAPMSKKRAGERKIYLERRKIFLKAHPICEAYEVLWPHEKPEPSTEIHHLRGRGKYFLEESTWLALSRRAHWWVHQHPSEARRLGLLA